MTVHTVPVIDLAPGPAATADLVGQACADVGYFQVTGHGIPSTLLAELVHVTRQFFALPAEVKAQVLQPAADQVRGWSGVGSEGITYSLDEESPADLKEKFDIGPVGVEPGPHHGPNLWPTAVRGFREPWEAAYRQFARVDALLQRSAGIALGLGPEALTRYFGQPLSMLRALHYPDQPEPPLPGQLRAGVHSDYGAFTLVVAEDRPGALQVLDRGGEWTDVPVIPGAVLVMLGDLLTEWTDDRWSATLHRVVNPRRDQAMDADRLAFAFYSHPDPETSLHVLPGLPGGDQPPPPGTPTAWEHLQDKYLRQTSFGPS